MGKRECLGIGNSMICSDIWHKYHEWYFEIVIRNYEPLGEWNLRQFWNITSGICAKYHVQIMLLFVYTTTNKSFVISTRRYFKLSWNTTALSQTNSRNISCRSIITVILRYLLSHSIVIALRLASPLLTSPKFNSSSFRKKTDTYSQYSWIAGTRLDTFATVKLKREVTFWNVLLSSPSWLCPLLWSTQLGVFHSLLQCDQGSVDWNEANM